LGYSKTKKRKKKRGRKRNRIGVLTSGSGFVASRGYELRGPSPDAISLL
jgi:hypothetical protein